MKIITIIIITSFINLLFGNFVGRIVNLKNKTLVASLYELSSGMMIGIVFFEMLPEVIEMSNVYKSIIYLICGMGITFLIEEYLNKKEEESFGLLLVLSMSLHNIVEGIAIGSSYMYSSVLGRSILIANILHDIPEYIVIGIGINKENGNKDFVNKMIACFSTAIGCVIGMIIGNISKKVMSLTIAMSGGCMLYLAFTSLNIDSKKLTFSKIPSVICILGIFVGILIANVV